MRVVSDHTAHWFSLCLGMFFLLAGSSGAGVFHYQGVLTDPDGNPVTGTRNLTFWLYPQAENGASLWKEGHSGVVLDAGHFSVDLGSLVAFGAGIDFSSDLYLQIAVNGQALAPRVKLRSVPKALCGTGRDGGQRGECADRDRDAQHRLVHDPGRNR